MVKYINFAFHHVFELLNAHIWSNMQQIYGQNSRRSPYIIVTDMTYLLVNWTDVTSTKLQPAGPEFAIARTNDPLPAVSEVWLATEESTQSLCLWFCFFY